MEHFPAAGEVVIFDRGWYNRAGVESVMDFVSDKDVERFPTLCPQLEKYIADAGIVLMKFWLEVGREEQEKRFIEDGASDVPEQRHCAWQDAMAGALLSAAR